MSCCANSFFSFDESVARANGINLMRRTEKRPEETDARAAREERRGLRLYLKNAGKNARVRRARLRENRK